MRILFIYREEEVGPRKTETILIFENEKKKKGVYFNWGKIFGTGIGMRQWWRGACEATRQSRSLKFDLSLRVSSTTVLRMAIFFEAKLANRRALCSYR